MLGVTLTTLGNALQSHGYIHPGHRTSFTVCALPIFKKKKKKIKSVCVNWATELNPQPWLEGSCDFDLIKSLHIPQTFASLEPDV